MPKVLISDGMRVWLRRIASFFLGQGAVQVFNLITGFLFIRWLSVEAFAQYSVAFGFQATAGMLVDLGVSGSIVALVGQRADDPAVVGAFIRSAKHYRAILFAVVVPIAAVAFFWMTGRQHWPWQTRAVLFGSILISLYYQGISAFYAAALLLQHRLGDYYRAQIVSSATRLTAGAAVYALGWLGAAAAAWLGTVSLVLNAILYRRCAAPLVREPTRANPVSNREMTGYLAPLLPGVIFYALQGQLTLFLITCFGKSHNIAEVAALGRLTQVLIVLGAFNGVIIEPHIARLPYVRLAKRYLLILSGGISVTLLLMAAGFFFPNQMLWIIGAKYAHLRTEFSWSLAAWGLNYLGGLLWVMHSARKWVFWWHTLFCCAALTLAQAFGVWLLDLSTTLGIFQFSLLTGGANLLAHCVGGIYGYWQEGRRLAQASAESVVVAESLSPNDGSLAAIPALPKPVL